MFVTHYTLNGSRSLAQKYNVVVWSNTYAICDMLYLILTHADETAGKSQYQLCHGK